MWAIGFEALKELWSNSYLRYFIVVLVSVAGIYYGYEKLTQHYYNEGVSYQQNVYKQEQDKLKADFAEQQAKADSDRLNLNNKIDSLKKDNQDLSTKLSLRATDLLNQGNEYEKENKIVNSCFNANDNGLLLLQKSFPASSD